MQGYGRIATFLAVVATGLYLANGNATLLIAVMLCWFVLLWDGVYRLTVVRQLTGTRRVDRTEIPWGEHLIEHVTLLNAARRGTTVTTVEPTNLPHHDGGFAVWLPGGSDITETIRVVCDRRGHFKLGQLVTQSMTPFHVFPFQQRVGQALHVTVLPRIVHLTGVALPIAGLSRGEEAGAGKGEMPPQVRTVREYVIGDPLSRVHWRKSAQHGALMTMEMEPQIRTTLCLIVDAACLPASDIEEALATIAASIATFACARLRVQLVIVGTPHTAQTLHDILHALAGLRGRQPTQEEIDTAAARVRRGQAVMLLTAQAPALWSKHIATWQTRGIRAGAIPITGDPYTPAPGWPIPHIAVPRQYADPAWTQELVQRIERGAV
jgi:uncharacterized protein (DUF58 family)